MDRKLVALCVLAVIFAVLIISGCTSAPASPTVSPQATIGPSASPGTYAGEGGFAENATAPNASVAPGMPANANDTTAK